MQDEQKVYKPSSKKILGWIIALLVVQLVYGAFMAGLKAAMAAPTWPDINGSYLPQSFTVYGGKQMRFLSSIINNPIAVHFIHRNLAYLLTVLIVAWSVKAVKEKGSPLFNRAKWLPLSLVFIQVALGIAAVLTSLKKVPQKWGVFEWTAQLHQITGMLLLLSLVGLFFLHCQNKSAAL